MWPRPYCRESIKGGLPDISELGARCCYTQLTDTLQEANGLATADRQPKLDAAVLRALITGRSES